MSTSRSGKTTMELLEEAVGWAKAAGELTLDWFNNATLSVESKDDGTPVTQADRAAERLLRDLIGAAYPDDGIQGEEEAEKVGSSRRRWVIDPIDGTKAFTHGVATYSNLLYMEDEAGPALGVINLPALGETVYAARGLGCFFNGEPCRVSGTSDMRRSYLSCTGFHMWSPDMFAKVTDAGLRLRTWGDAYGYALVATGRIEAMMDPILARWDIVAPAIIVSEAGGVVTTRDGNAELSPDADGNYSALASNGQHHEALVRILAS